jgi:hypothetical protein
VTKKRTTSVEIAAKVHGVSRGVGYEAARTGAIPTIRLGRRLVVPIARLAETLGEDPDQLARVIESMEAEQTPCPAVA